MDVPAMNSYLLLIHDLIGGTIRRNTFTPLELDLLLDVQASQMRKSAKQEMLRRYLRTVQQQFASDGSAPLRFAQFRENESSEGACRGSQPALPLLRARTATPG